MREPRLEALTHRLADCPAEFLLDLQAEEAGQVVPSAVVYDVLAALGGALTSAEAKELSASGKAARRRACLTMTAAWLLADESFAGLPGTGLKAKEFLLSLKALSEIAEPVKFVTDPDRREELARLALKAMGLRPAGETAAQAEDRLSALDSLETRRTAQASKAAQERARAVMEAMKLKAAEEAASKASRE